MTLLCASVLIGGCATSASVCAGREQITMSRDDVLTRETLEKIVANNEAGEQLGCWRGK